MKTALIVEDDFVSASVFALATSECGYARVVVAHSVDEARIHLSHERFDVIILDYLLAGDTAFSLFPHIPPTSHVILITALSKLPEQAIQFANDTLFKPFGLDELCEKLKAS
jgi:DNA-binding response OmpR family regulator